MTTRKKRQLAPSKPAQAAKAESTESEHQQAYRNWLRTQASIENVVRALSKRRISSRDLVGPVLEWVEFRMAGDPWIQKELDGLSEGDAEKLTQSLAMAIISFSKASDPKPAVAPHQRKLHKERAKNAIKKLVAALEIIECDPALPDLLVEEPHKWARDLIQRELRETPREAYLMSQILKRGGPDPDAFEEMRKIHHSRKRVPTAVSLLVSLEQMLRELEIPASSKLSPRSIFLCEVWGHLFGHALEKKVLHPSPGKAARILRKK